MKTLVYILALAVLSAFGTAASADDYTAGDLRIANPWAKASLKGVPNSAAYLTITNTGATADTLVAASTGVSNAVELHTMSMEDGVMRMRRLEGGVPLPAGETVKLEPGGKHIMLIGLKDRLEDGETVSMTLTFENAGQLDVQASVQARQNTGDHDHGAMDGAGHEHGS